MQKNNTKADFEIGHVNEPLNGLCILQVGMAVVNVVTSF
jgi:hypothetical protein